MDLKSLLKEIRFGRDERPRNGEHVKFKPVKRLCKDCFIDLNGVGMFQSGLSCIVLENKKYTVKVLFKTSASPDLVAPDDLVILAPTKTLMELEKERLILGETLNAN